MVVTPSMAVEQEKTAHCKINELRWIWADFENDTNKSTKIYFGNLSKIFQRAVLKPQYLSKSPFNYEQYRKSTELSNNMWPQEEQLMPRIKNDKKWWQK